MSDGYAAAYRKSAEFLARLAQRSKAQKIVPANTDNQECKLASPQGPLGELTTTHTTVGQNGNNVYTWFYVVAVQLASNFSVLPHHFGTVAIQQATHGCVSFAIIVILLG